MGETRTIVKSAPAESFFNAFESRKAPESKEDQDDEDEEVEKLLDALDETMQVAMDFNDLYTFEALEYYLNFGQLRTSSTCTEPVTMRTRTMMRTRMTPIKKPRNPRRLIKVLLLQVMLPRSKNAN